MLGRSRRIGTQWLKWIPANQPQIHCISLSTSVIKDLPPSPTEGEKKTPTPKEVLPYKKTLDTILSGAGCDPSDASTGAITPPIYLSTTFERNKETLELDRGFNYSRLGNPTRLLLERFMTELEEGKESFAFSSGMQGVMALFTSLPNSYVLLPDDLYHGVYVLLIEIFSKWNVKFEKIDMTDHKLINQKLQGLKVDADKYSKVLIWIETPSNPLCKVTDIPKIVELSKSVLPESKSLIVVDATWSTPYLLRPLLHGADVVLHSTTKYINGHSDSTGGIVTFGSSTNAQSVIDTFRIVHQVGGGVLSPFDSWLTLRGLRTLHVRMKSHCDNAMAVAEYLQGHKAVEKVFYPGLVNHPQNKLATTLMNGKYGGMLSVSVKQKKSSPSLEHTALEVQFEFILCSLL